MPKATIEDHLQAMREEHATTVTHWASGKHDDAMLHVLAFQAAVISAVEALANEEPGDE